MPAPLVITQEVQEDDTPTPLVSPASSLSSPFLSASASASAATQPTPLSLTNAPSAPSITPAAVVQSSESHLSVPSKLNVEF